MSSAVDDFMAQGMDEDDLAVIGEETGWSNAATGTPVSSPALDALQPPEPPSAAAPDGSKKPGLAASMAKAKEALDAEGPGVFAWRFADRERIAGQWGQLREFVDWIVDVYRLESEAEHVPCWWRHPDLVQEWDALRHLHVLSYKEDNSGDGPNNFHYWLSAFRQRVRSSLARVNCTVQEGHQEPYHGAVPTRISDEEWADLTGSDAQYEAASSWPRWVEAEASS